MGVSPSTTSPKPQHPFGSLGSTVTLLLAEKTRGACVPAVTGSSASGHVEARGRAPPRQTAPPACREGRGVGEAARPALQGHPQPGRRGPSGPQSPALRIQTRSCGRTPRRGLLLQGQVHSGTPALQALPLQGHPSSWVNDTPSRDDRRNPGTLLALLMPTAQ